MRRRSAVPAMLLALVVMLLGAATAGAEQLVFTLSTDNVRITSDFRGVTLVAFGAIEHEADTPSWARYDAVVVMRGPSETLVTRRKERLAGIWINRASATFYSLPSFYNVAASRPLEEIAGTETLTRYGIGAAHLDLAPTGGKDDDGAFRAALIRLKQRANLFAESSYGVLFPAASVFKAELEIPANVPVGDYTVTAYLFRAGAMVASDGIAVRVSKEGFERFTFEFARRQGFLYGLICVALALLTGWLAGVIFRRD